MKIRYRDAKGHFLSEKKAKRRKQVRSEIYDPKTNKKIGKTVSGFYSEIKKLARAVMPVVKTRKQKEYTPRRKAKPQQRTIRVEPEFEEEELDDEELEELEAEWIDEFQDGFGELDAMDDLDELLDDEDEWYEHI